MQLVKLLMVTESFYLTSCVIEGFKKKGIFVSNFVCNLTRDNLSLNPFQLY